MYVLNDIKMDNIIFFDIHLKKRLLELNMTDLLKWIKFAEI